MAFEYQVLRRAMARHEKNRLHREDELIQARQKAYLEEPELAEIDQKLRVTMAKLVGVTLTDGKSAVESIRAENLALQHRRNEILQSIGMHASDLDETPACKHCADSGWQGTRMCVCLMALCMDEQMKELSKLLPLGSQSFDTFNLDFYGDDAREGMELIFEVCLNYAQKFDRFPVKNLCLSGAPGLGKTFLSACIARTVSEGGHSVVYDTAISVFGHFEDRKFSRNDDETMLARDEARRYLSCDLLILDDLGSELTTSFTQSALYELVNTRLLAGLHTVISTNLSMEEIASRYTPAIYSRLDGEYHVLYFTGTDIRKLKKEQF